MLVLAAVALVALLLGACGSSEINKPEIGKVNTAAVIIFTVPTQIEYRDDPQQTEKSLLQAVAQAAASGDGVQAATVSYGTFTEAMNQQGLPFRVLSATETKGNADFGKMVMMAPKKEESSGGAMSAAMSMLGGASQTEGAAPDGMRQFGIPQDWSGGNPLMGTPEETQFIKDAIQALNVDAAIVVADPGYSFACEACIGGAGAGTTGSAFMVAFVNRDGLPILAMREWFATTDEQATMLAYAVNPLEHDDLYEEHGRKMAEVFATAFKEKMAEN